VRTEQPEIYDSDIPVNPFELDHTLTNLLEFEEALYYFLLSDETREGKEREFTLNISSFKKKDGEHYKTGIQSLKGTPSALTTTFLCLTGEYKKG
jgi:hypothetical protein